MSAYLNFYLKDKSGNWNYLDSFSRSSAVYEYGNDYAPYEAGKPLSASVCSDILGDIDRELSNYDKTVKSYNDQKALIASMNNSVEDKLEAINDVNNCLEEVEEITNGLIAARGFYATMYGIADSAKWSSSRNDEDFIYFGIEWCPGSNEEE